MAAGVSGAAAILGVTAGAPAAGAQTPAAGYFMKNAMPYQGYPNGANAVVVEGHGVLPGCSLSGYDALSKVEGATYNFVQTNIQAVTEVAPQSYCGSIGKYKTLMKSIVNYMYTNGTRSKVNRYWGGIMVDEERSYGFTASKCKSLNKWIVYYENSHNRAGATTLWAENSTGWSIPTQYRSVMTSAAPAPQVYYSGDASRVNKACTSGVTCTNAITLATHAYSTSYSKYSKVGPLVKGSPVTISTWGSKGWYNKWNVRSCYNSQGTSRSKCP
ncbi:MAG: hypothetical protein M0035_18035 [Actinomycetota bacterium]|jgi:hypothetical protein|nr:hypothetical protein [Actinomycetota bacterium]